MTITYDALELTVQFPHPSLAPWKLDLGPFLALAPAPQTSDPLAMPSVGDI